VAFGRARNIEFHLTEEFIVVINEGHSQLNGFAHAGLRKVLFDAFPIGCVGQLLANLGEVVLTVGVLDMGQEFRPLAHQMTTAAEQIASRPHRGRVNVGHGKHPAAQPHGDLVGVNLVVLGLAATNRLQRERVAQDEGHARAGTEISEPIPAEDTLHRDDHIVAVRGNDP
jgi:hypothetical protein